MIKWLRWPFCKLEWCKFTGPCVRRDFGNRVYAFSCKACHRFWVEIYAILLVALAASSAQAATTGCRLVKISGSWVILCPAPGRSSLYCLNYIVNGEQRRVCWNVCRQCSIGATGTMQCRYVAC